MADHSEQEAELLRQGYKIVRLVGSSRGNAQLMRRAHQDAYGFEATEKFVTDLAAYVRNPTRRPEMLVGDAEQVRKNLQDVYGFWVTREYANDLIAFAQSNATRSPSGVKEGG